jgi:hypothetical protein
MALRQQTRLQDDARAQRWSITCRSVGQQEVSRRRAGTIIWPTTLAPSAINTRCNPGQGCGLLLTTVLL